MKRFRVLILLSWVVAALMFGASALAQQAPPAQSSQPATPAETDARAYSGMYTFLKEGEFVQVTVEDNGTVNGFISRYEEGSDKGKFLDQFFKTGKLEGNKLTFTTKLVHGLEFDFKGTVERGDGKNPGDDAYFVLKGTLTENTTDANKKVTSNSHDVVFRAFPQDEAPK